MRAAAALIILLSAAGSVCAQYQTRVVAMKLNAPTGIAVRGSNLVYFTEVPTPGVPGGQGGTNAVKVLHLSRGRIDTISAGEPEPVNLALDRSGRPFWTCRSAGVILMQNNQGSVQPFLTGLNQPTGIDVRHDGLVYFTQVPTPGVPGSLGGTNETNASDGITITTLTVGEPEPYDIAVARDGTVYWTCKSAGVILTRTPAGQVSLLLGDLSEPTGIALDETRGHLWFTEVPTPGVPGSMGGLNTVNRLDLATSVRVIVNQGDPEPTDVAVATNGKAYWTCTSAGVIVEAAPIRRPQ